MNRILVAEDEEELRRGLALALRTEGYSVVEAANGADALNVILSIAGDADGFDLLICDHQMPVMTGEELLLKLKALRIAIPALIMTGYGEKNLIIRLMRAGCSNFIDKPFEPEVICRSVAAMLEESAAAADETRRMRNLARIGENTLETAHDLNNMLGGVIGNADSALEEIDHDHPARQSVEKLLAASGRAIEICRKILENSRDDQTVCRVATEINSLAGRVGALLSDIAPQNITVETSTLPAPVWFDADAQRLQQAVLNLGFNAFTAMEGHGTIRISVALRDVVRPLGATPAVACVVLTVADTGRGMNIDEITRAFNKGYSTHAGGFEIGLPLVKRIVEDEHGGWIDVKSEQGKGSSFALCFPVK